MILLNPKHIVRVLWLWQLLSLTKTLTTSAEDFGEGDECPLDCQNGGVCSVKLGPTDAPASWPGAISLPPSAAPQEITVEQQGQVREKHNSRRHRNIEEFQTWEAYCECPEGFSGYFCQDDANCELECQNGGFCRVWEDIDEIAVQGNDVNHDSPTTRRKTRRRMDEEGVDSSNSYCVCPNGYIGFYCEELDNETSIPCTLECLNGGECSVGTWDDVPALDDDLFRRLEETAVDDAVTPEQPVLFCICPYGYAGPLCEETTGRTNGSCILPCQNGGDCMFDDVAPDDDSMGARRLEDPGIFDDALDYPEDQFCRCRAPFYGKLCERSNLCSLQCLNGGACVVADPPPDSDDAVSYGESCLCLQGYYGTTCQTIYTPVTEQEKEQCSMSCDSTGMCGGEWILISEAADGDVFDDDMNTGAEYECVCQSCNTTGDIGTCQDGGPVICENGGTCIDIATSVISETRQGLTSSGERFFCDCSTAYDPSMGSLFAGRFCQHMSTSVCNPLANEEEGEGLEQTLFCVNEGICQDYAGGVSSCTCPVDFYGGRCEFNQTELEQGLGICFLECLHDSTCVSGIVSVPKIFEHFGVNGGDMTEKSLEGPSSLASLLKEEAMHEDFQYCHCPNQVSGGYFGTYCEHAYTICGEREHICLYSSECRQGNKTGNWYCDCGPAESPRAGAYCQHPITAFCDTSGDRFCTNGGQCSEDVSGERVCYCPAGTFGRHCEILDVPTNPPSIVPDSNLTEEASMFPSDAPSMLPSVTAPDSTLSEADISTGLYGAVSRSPLVVTLLYFLGAFLLF